jgi:16S rRNA (cytosine1402-N4)-methyltransferase
MLAEVLAALAPRDGALYIDGTFGAGGYSSGILDAADTRVLGFDRDPSAVSAAAGLVARYEGRLDLVEARFGEMGEVAPPIIAAAGVPLAGIVLDIGVSSMQLDEAERGFSFQADGPLDMRMGHAGGRVSEGAGPSAAEVVNTAPERLIADILYQLGEERRSRAIASAIVRRRAEQPLASTRDLAEIVTRVLGRPRPGERHPATRTFQALRIWVNDELGELARALLAAEALLPPGGRLVVVTFHSLEDRIVKQFMAMRTGRTPGMSRHLPAVTALPEPSFRIVNSKPLIPSNEEIAANPRARSARLRAAERTEAPAWKPDWKPEWAALGLPEVLLGR